MKKLKKPMFTHILNVICVALIVECFLCSMMMVKMYAKENCFDHIEEITGQMSEMFVHAFEDRQDKLTVFADILAANQENPDELLQKYMESFCRTQYFAAVCIHRADGSTEFYGDHPHEENKVEDFAAEAARLPYVSEIYSVGDAPEDKYFSQAVPIIRGEETVAILYGYTSLDALPGFISSAFYDGECEFYIVDGETGDFLMDEYHGYLGNIYDGSMGDRETKPEYDANDMRDGVRNGQSGYFIFRSQRTGQWYYTYYMPLGINKWSMQLTIDEPTAFSGYNNINKIIVALAVSVIVLMFAHVLVLMAQERIANAHDKRNLHKSQYIASVQRTLLNAHTNPDAIEQVLKLALDEVGCETTLLLIFNQKIATDVRYWPSKDKFLAARLLNQNIRDTFPLLYDILAENRSICYDSENPCIELCDNAKLWFSESGIKNLMLVPIMDNTGILKGAICAVNAAQISKGCEMLECVTYDFFMAITNQENHDIIKNMGAMDYLTGIKNRNSYEAEVADYRELDCRSLWCVFIDVNGLHEVNNAQGHKAGDGMLCAVADAIKRVFGKKHTYRLGGDEFVAFATDSSAGEFARKKKAICDELAAKGYYVSVGYKGIEKSEDGTFDVDRVVSDAEAIMYRDKWEYYQRNNIPSERGHFPELIARASDEK